MPRVAKAQIIRASWDLFRERGFENTTVDEIIERAGIAKGTFYHHFQGKSSLLGTLSVVLDEKYRELEVDMDPSLTAVEQIRAINLQMFDYIENNIPVELFQAQMASQLNPRGDRSLLDNDRYYFALHRKLVAKGQENGEITRNVSVHDIVRYYTMAERSMMYDWCLHQGSQPLVGEPTQIVAQTLDRFVIKEELKS